jgi:hypothetical protein
MIALPHSDRRGPRRRLPSHNDIDDRSAPGAGTGIRKPVEFNGLAEAIRTMTDDWFGIALLPKQHNREANP